MLHNAVRHANETTSDPVPLQYEGLVEHEQRGCRHHPRQERGVHAAPAGTQHQREHDRPSPAPRPPQAAMRSHHQPRHGHVGEQGHRGAAPERGHVRVDREQHARSHVGDAAAPAVEVVHEQHHAPGGKGEQAAHPEALRDPHRDPDRVREREPGRHREQVAHELRAPNVPEVGGRAPELADLVQEQARVCRQLHPRIGERLPGTLCEGSRERARREDERNPPRRHAGGQS